MQVLRVVLIVVAGAVLAQAAAVVDTKDVDTVEVVEAKEPAVAVPAVTPSKSKATGRTFDEWGQQLMEWMGFESDYDDYDDYSDYYNNDYGYTYYFPQSASAQLGYGLPAGGYVSPSGGSDHSSYTSYTPVHVAPVRQFHHPARDDKYEDEGWSMTDVMFNVAATVVPLGLLLSALPTGLFTFAVRRRSLDEANFLQETIDPSELPLLQTLMDSDLLALTSRDCQEKLFCELTRIGEHKQASLMQQVLYYVATLTPDYMARKVGLARLFRMSRAGKCGAFRCSATWAPSGPAMAVQLPTDTNRIMTQVPTKPEEEAELTTKE